MQLTIRTIGQLVVHQNGAPIELPKSKKARALLVFLACNPRRVSKERLVSMLFADTKDPRGSLRWSISRLRACLGDVVASDAEIVQINPDVDLIVDFLELEAAVHSGDPQHLERLFEGEFLGSLSLPSAAEYEAWRLTEQAKCSRQQNKLLTALIRSNIGSPSAIEWGRKLVALDASNEAAWSLLVRALLAANQHAEARRVQKVALDTLTHEGVVINGLLDVNSIEQDSATDSAIYPPMLTPSVAVLACNGAARHRTKLADITELVNAATRTSKLFATVGLSLARELQRTKNDAYAQAAELGIDLVMQSAAVFRKANTSVNVSLIECSTRQTLYSWRISVPSSNQDEIVATVEQYLGARLEVDIPVAMAVRSLSLPRKEWSALDYCLHGIAHLTAKGGGDPSQAKDLLETALVRKPYHGLSACMLALTRMFMPGLNSDQVEIANTLSLARRAVENGQDDPFILGIAGMIIGQIAHKSDTGLDLARRALSINPFSIIASLAAALLHHYTGDISASESYLAKNEQFAENSPVAYWHFTIKAMNAYQSNDYIAAIYWGDRALGHNPLFVVAQRYLTAALGKSTETLRAEASATRLMAVDSSENLHFFRRHSSYRQSQHRNHLIQGLAEAGVRER